MAKVIINGETFDYDGRKQPMHEALWIEHVYKRRYGEWQDDLAAGSARALVLLACLIWRRDGRDVDTAFQDVLDGKIDFDLNEMLLSMAEAGQAEAAAAAEAEEGAEFPMPAGSDPAGTPTTGTPISASSPKSSGTRRRK